MLSPQRLDHTKEENLVLSPSPKTETNYLKILSVKIYPFQVIQPFVNSIPRVSLSFLEILQLILHSK